MSLWHKRADDITADDVDQFLQKGFREGLRLDYKREVSDAGKHIAALANSFGGLLILGVAAT